MSDIEKLYLSNSISNGAARNGSDFDDNAINAIPPEQSIDNFVNSATRPIRARQSRSRPGTTCLYQIGDFEHLLEKLGFVFMTISKDGGMRTLLSRHVYGHDSTRKIQRTQQ